MKQRTCFVNVPAYATYHFDYLSSGKYTMYYYGPSAEDSNMVIVESLKGDLKRIPKEWVKLI